MKKVAKNVINRFIRAGDWLSAGINSFFFDGCTDESMSGRSYRMDAYENNRKWRRFRKVVDWVWVVVFREDNHCRGAYYKDLARAEAYRERHYQYMQTQQGRFERQYTDSAR